MSSTAPGTPTPARPPRRRGVGPFSLRQVAAALGVVVLTAVILTVATAPLGSTNPGLPNPEPSAYLLRSPVPGLAIGDLAPELEGPTGDGATFLLTDLDANVIRLADLRGRGVWLNFWASWCPPCRAEMPHLREAYKRYQAQGFEILGMNADEPEMVPNVKDGLKKYGAEWTQAKRESVVGVMEQLGIDSYPTTLLIGPDGKVVSLNKPEKQQLSLRGAELVRSVESVVTHQ